MNPPEKRRFTEETHTKNYNLSRGICTTVLAFRGLLCYVEAAGCRKPTNKAYAGRAVLLMQPAPLTGTATAPFGTFWSLSFRMQPAPLTGTATMYSAIAIREGPKDAARTPHGDGNMAAPILKALAFLADAARTPHGDGNVRSCFLLRRLGDAARTPLGDGNIICESSMIFLKMWHASLTGTIASMLRRR